MWRMAVFFGEMQTKSDNKRMKAVVTIDRGNIRLASGTTELGEWPLHKVRIEEYTDRSYLVSVEDEELIMFLDEHQKFAGEVGRFLKKPGDDRRQRTHPAFDKQIQDGPSISEELKDDVSREMAPILKEAQGWLDAIPRGRPLWIALGIVALVFIVIPQVIVFTCLIGGAIALLAGGLAYSDDRLAVRLPDRVTPTELVAGGAIALLVGLVVLFIPWGGLF
jgi:hypothetical protein